MKTDEPAAEDGIPSWARPLFAGKIVVTAETNVEQLAAVLEERLDALFILFNCSPNEAGWRRLALNLALGFSIDGTRVMDIATPIDRDPKGGGRPAEFGPFFWMTQARRMIEAGAKEGVLVSDAEAARAISKHFKDAPSPKRIQNLLSKMKDKSLSDRLEWDHFIEQVLNIAGDRLSNASR
jgi:hypothetical protein